jgi:hypothetical protein
MPKETNDAARNGKLPVGCNEDVEFSREMADEDDIEAQERAAAADRRAEAGRTHG